MKKKSVEYVDNKKLLEELKKHRLSVLEAERLGVETPKYSNYIGKTILDIAVHLSHKPIFANYTFREDMIGDGIENCLLYLHNFNSEKYQNPFAYITTIIYYAFLRRIEREKKLLYVKYKTTANHGIYHDVIHDDGAKPVETYDNIMEFIETFEKKKDNKSKIKAGKKKVVKKGLEAFIEDEIDE